MRLDQFPSLKGFDLCLDIWPRSDVQAIADEFPSLKGFDLCLDPGSERHVQCHH